MSRSWTDGRTEHEDSARILEAEFAILFPSKIYCGVEQYYILFRAVKSSLSRKSFSSVALMGEVGLP